jgi:hypothetical protein
VLVESREHPTDAQLAHSAERIWQPSLFGQGEPRPDPDFSGLIVVMGGTSQRTWLHAVPKAAAAGPRISVAYRHSA